MNNSIKTFIIVQWFDFLLNSKFKKDLSFSYIAQFVAMLAGFIQLFLVNKYLGVESFGQLTIIVSTIGVFTTLLSARSSESVTKFLIREELKGHKGKGKFILYIGFIIDILTAIILSIIIYYSAKFIANVFLKDAKLFSEVFLYSFVSFCLFLRGTIIGYFQAKQYFYKINLITIIESSLLIFFLIVVVSINESISIYEVIIAILLSSVITLLFIIYSFFNHYIKHYSNVNIIFDYNLLSEYLYFNIKTFTSSTLKAGNQNIDNLLLGYFTNTYLVGIYQTIKRLLLPIFMVSKPFSSLIYPKLISYFETNNINELKSIILRISLYILIFSITYIFIGNYLLEIVFRYMNIELMKEYYIYYFLVSIQIILIVLMWWVRPFSNTVNPNYSIHIALFHVIVNIIIGIPVVWLFGLYGMLIYQIFAYTLVLSYIIFKLRNI